MVNAEVDKDGKPLVLGGEVECRLGQTITYVLVVARQLGLR